MSPKIRNIYKKLTRYSEIGMHYYITVPLESPDSNGKRAIASFSLLGDNEISYNTLEDIMSSCLFDKFVYDATTEEMQELRDNDTDGWSTDLIDHACEIYKVG